MTDAHIAQNALEDLSKKLDESVIINPEAGDYRIARDIYTDPVLFELEMKYIFEGNWVFLGHEDQVRNKNDFLTTYIGRQAVILTRNSEGELGCFINACAHRGARVCREKKGNKKILACPFHGWCYDSGGRLVDYKEDGAGYPESFDPAQHGLTPIPRLESYRGFLWASLSDDVVPLADYLGGTRTLIDLIVDQSPEKKLEILRGSTRYSYKGNWKLQAENGLDGYHVQSTHGNYVMTVMRRAKGESTNKTKTMDLADFSKIAGGFYAFEHGHALLWTGYPNYKDRPNYEVREAFEKEFGTGKAEWMNARLRNLMLFPNVFLMDQTSTQIRIFRPVAVNQTEVTTYCMAPKGESAPARALRIRQYEDFFNASGMATPDDLTEFENCQTGYEARNAPWNDVSRGATHWVKGTNEVGRVLDLGATLSGSKPEDEGLYVVIHENWLKRMKKAVAQEMNDNKKNIQEAAE